MENLSFETVIIMMVLDEKEADELHLNLKEKKADVFNTVFKFYFENGGYGDTFYIMIDLNYREVCKLVDDFKDYCEDAEVESDYEDSLLYTSNGFCEYMESLGIKHTWIFCSDYIEF